MALAGTCLLLDATGKSGAVVSSGERRVPPASAAISPPVVPIGGGSQFPAIAGPGVRNKPETPSSLDKTNDAAYLPPNSESGDAADMRSSKSKIVAPPSSGMYTLAQSLSLSLSLLLSLTRGCAPI